MAAIKLTHNQMEAIKVFTSFLSDPTQKYMVIQGTAGTGKSTLIKFLMKAVKAQHKIYSLLAHNNDQVELDPVLTATTHKAAAVMNELSDAHAMTIHSFLQLKLVPNYTTGEQDLKRGRGFGPIHDKLVIIDEASMINDKLFTYIDETLCDSKVVLIGDINQLAPVNQKYSMMETINCKKFTLTQVMRHGSSILDTSTQWRNTVQTGIFQPITTSPNIIFIDGPACKQLILEKYNNSQIYSDNHMKILAWTNERVQEYNKHIRKIKQLSETFKKDERVTTQNPIMDRGKIYHHVDEQVIITRVSLPIQQQGIWGHNIEINKGLTKFMADDPLKTKALLKKMAAKRDWKEYFKIKENWMDLRSLYASTVHKAQGSTYGTVLIDLNDIGRCNIPLDVARMLYVGISRAQHQVYLYGKLPNKYGGIHYSYR